MRTFVSITTLCLLAACSHESAQGPSLSARQRARAWVDAGEPGRAIPLLEQLRRESPRDFELARALAEAYAKDGRSQALIDSLEHAPNDAITHYLRGLAYYSRAADADGKAVSELSAAAKLAPNEPEPAFRLGLALLEAERFESALPPLRQARQLAPERSSYALPLAKALFRAGERKESIEEIRKVIAAQPSPAEVKSARGLMEQIADPFVQVPKAARTRLDSALEALHTRDLPQQAIVTLEELALEYPDLSSVHQLLGLAYRRVDDVGRAAFELKRAIELAPEDGSSHLQLALLYSSRQQSKSAEEHFRAALERDPTLDDAYWQLAELALERQELTRAGELFSVLTYLRPDAIAPRGKLALVFQLQQQWAAAEKQLERILETEPKSVEFKLRMGILHTEHFRKASTAAERKSASGKAARWLEQVLAEQPENAVASRALETVKAR